MWRKADILFDRTSQALIVKEGKKTKNPKLALSYSVRCDAGALSRAPGISGGEQARDGGGRRARDQDPRVPPHPPYS